MITVCVFAKPPLPGACKSRLAAAIGPERAAALAAALLADVWTLARSRPWARPVLAVTAPLLLTAEQWPQGDGDLGARLERILRRAGGPAIALGADTAGLPTAYLDEAALSLARGHAVLGPAADGGFYLLGLPHCPPSLLSDLPWSTPTTLAAITARLRLHPFPLHLLPPWFDIDLAPDVAHLVRYVAPQRPFRPGVSGSVR